MSKKFVSKNLCQKKSDTKKVTHKKISNDKTYCYAKIQERARVEPAGPGADAESIEQRHLNV